MKFPLPFNFQSQVILSTTSVAANTENKQENNVTFYFHLIYSLESTAWLATGNTPKTTISFFLHQAPLKEAISEHCTFLPYLQR